MTGEGELHEGEIFFPLPDGTGVLHKLTGRSNPPEPAGSLAFKVTAKQAHSETLKVANWLNVPQRFKVLIEQDTEDPAIRLTGSKNIDVPGLSEREFKVRFYSWKPGSTTAKVTFQNEITGEYLFYNLSYERCSRPRSRAPSTGRGPCGSTSAPPLPSPTPSRRRSSWRAGAPHGCSFPGSCPGFRHKRGRGHPGRPSRVHCESEVCGHPADVVTWSGATVAPSLTSRPS